jgi:hypothetical protein
MRCNLLYDGVDLDPTFASGLFSGVGVDPANCPEIQILRKASHFWGPPTRVGLLVDNYVVIEMMYQEVDRGYIMPREVFLSYTGTASTR